MNLWQHFLDNPGSAIYKWHHYFPVYERHFSPWRNRSLTFWEIGVLKGGSLEMWQRFFGPFARIVGLDIDPSCKSCEKHGINVRIGNQSDPAFLDAVCEEFGVPDIVLDDGSHYMHDLWNTFSHLYPKLGKNAIYALEDLQTCYWEEYGGGNDRPETFINRAKGLIDELNADQTRGAINPTKFTRSTYSISFYDSLVVFEKGDVWRKEAPVTGHWDDRSTKPLTVSAPVRENSSENQPPNETDTTRTPASSPSEKSIVSHWQLDSPLPHTSHFTVGEDLVIAGWALAADDEQARLHVVIRTGGLTRSYPLEIERHDVIEKILHETPDGHPKQRCGFYILLPPDEGMKHLNLEVGFEVEGSIQLVAEFSMAPALYSDKPL